MHFDDLFFERRAYDPWQGYGQSKTANVLLAVEATRRWADDGIVANALMPGGIMTNLQRYVTQEVKDRWQRMQDEGRDLQGHPPGRGHVAGRGGGPELATGGHYLEDCNEAPTVANDARVSAGVREWALDPEAAARLWDGVQRAGRLRPAGPRVVGRFRRADFGGRAGLASRGEADHRTRTSRPCWCTRASSATSSSS